MSKQYRTEKDLLGSKKIPSDSYWGINTQRAIENFQVSGLKNHPELIRALVEIKLSAATLFRDCRLADSKICNPIISTCKKILNGNLSEYFAIDIFQAGAGTSLNMNINEVIANMASETLGAKKGSYIPVHPNDHVNRAQSTNDIVPTAARIAVLRLSQELLAAMEALSRAFLAKSKEFKYLIKSGRTHLNDATPVTLGNEFLAYAITVRKDSESLKDRLANLHIVGIGGTATGSGLTAPKEYRQNIVRYVSKTTKLRLKGNPSLFEAMQNQGEFAHFMGSLKVSSLNLIRICNDLRLLSSGPRTGLNEIHLPEVQAGSSIMPGKINPSILEMVTMVCFYVCGMEQTVAMAVQAGQLELNVMMPVIAHGTLTSIEYLKNALNIMTNKCVTGITANKEILRLYAENSLGIATVLTPYIGYEKTAQLVREAKKTKKPIIEIVRKQNILTEEEIQKLLYSTD